MSGKAKKKKLPGFLPFPEGDDVFSDGALDDFGLDGEDDELDLDVTPAELDDETELIGGEEEERDYYSLDKDESEDEEDE
jgi:hypothetical protein